MTSMNARKTSRFFTIGVVIMTGALIVAIPACRRSNRWRDTRPQTFPVTGIVTLDGEPLEQAFVTFVAKESQSVAAGLTDAGGRFSLRTYEPGDGAVAGPQVVLIEKTTEVFPPAKGSDGPFPPPVVTHHLPAAYRDPQTSGLEATVNDRDRNHFTFELSSK